MGHGDRQPSNVTTAHLLSAAHATPSPAYDDDDLDTSSLRVCLDRRWTDRRSVGELTMCSLDLRTRSDRLTRGKKVPSITTTDDPLPLPLIASLTLTGVSVHLAAISPLALPSPTTSKPALGPRCPSLLEGPT